MNKYFKIVLSLLIGLIVLGIFLYRTGVDSIVLILSNINPYYLGLFLLFSSATFIPTVWRWGIVLNAYGKKVPFWSLMKYTIAGFAVSYVTPSARVGGEPLRAYMLYKEQGVDLRTGSSSIIIEKFIELSGSIAFGIFGMFLFFSLPGISTEIKIFFGLAVIFGFIFLLIFYYRCLVGKGSFSSLFLLFRLDKIAKWKGFTRVIIDVEKRLHKFFVKDKKAFLASSMTYILYGILVYFEFKFLLLGLGFDGSFREIVLTIIVQGFVGFIPVPGALGFLEAGQSLLFGSFGDKGGIGFVLAIFQRIRHLIFVAIGFAIVTYFGGGLFGGKPNNVKRKIK